MKSIFPLFVVVLCTSMNIYAQNKDSFVITKEHDTIYFDNIKISYYKRAICSNNDGKKLRFHARKLIEVHIGDKIYESGRIIPLVIGWKKFMLLPRKTEEIENQTILIYYYSGREGGAVGNNNAQMITTYAIRNRNNNRGDFQKLSLNVRKKILITCPDCSQECINIINNTEINKRQDVFTIISTVNKLCSSE